MNTSCLLVVDMQNDFVRPGAPFEVPDARDITANITALAKAFESAGSPVVYTRYIADESVLRLAEDVPWINKLKPPVHACTPGHVRTFSDGVEADGAAIVKELEPGENAWVVDKVLYSAFSETQLGPDLVSKGISNLYVTGVATEICVDDTARHAVHLGFDAALVADACASAERSRHDWTLDNFRRNYGPVVTTAELAARLAGSDAR